MIDTKSRVCRERKNPHAELFAGRNLIWVSEIHVMILVDYYIIYNVPFFWVILKWDIIPKLDFDH